MPPIDKAPSGKNHIGKKASTSLRIAGHVAHRDLIARRDLRGRRRERRPEPKGLARRDVQHLDDR
jgi:hypothetical protein